MALRRRLLACMFGFSTMIYIVIFFSLKDNTTRVHQRSFFENTDNHTSTNTTNITTSSLPIKEHLPTDMCPETELPEGGETVDIQIWDTNISDVEGVILQSHTTAIRDYVANIDRLSEESLRNVSSDSPTNVSGDSLSTVSTDSPMNVSGNLPKSSPLAEYRRWTFENYRPTLSNSVVLDEYIYIPGGHWIPATCQPLWKVAVIIPFRHRDIQLSILLKHLIPFLRSQHLEFGIFVTEQSNEKSFNKAMLMNIAFKESQKYAEWDCVIFHDVDHIPMNYGNYYGCKHLPRHFISGEARWSWHLPYFHIFGAAIGLTISQFEKVNGFSNMYWGWGGEDDEMSQRVRFHGFEKSRPEGPVGYHSVITAHHTASGISSNARFCFLQHVDQRAYSDGLSNLQYPKPTITVLPLFVKISTDIQPLEWNQSWAACGTEYYKSIQ